jgi:hypothetical protein
MQHQDKALPTPHRADQNFKSGLYPLKQKRTLSMFTRERYWDMNAYIGQVLD